MSTDLQLAHKPESKIWHAPWSIFENNGDNHAIVILNTPINFPEDVAPLILDIWNTANIRITVDGGTDRWLQWLTKMKIPLSAAKDPQLITGDMDSILPQTLEYFASQTESLLVYTKDQNKTDFTKALIELSSYKDRNNIEVRNVLVFCDLSGRFDQTISNINSLYMAKTILLQADLFLFSACSLTWLLEPNVEHKIIVPRNLIEEKKCCGLMPIGGRSVVTTTGLKWNLANTPLEFGKLVSTSNTYDGIHDFVKVNCDFAITWTMEIDSFIRYQFNKLYQNKSANKL